jgi:hypothetical protein
MFRKIIVNSVSRPKTVAKFFLIDHVQPFFFLNYDFVVGREKGATEIPPFAHFVGGCEGPRLQDPFAFGVLYRGRRTSR